MGVIIGQLSGELIAALEVVGTEERAINEKRYLKSPPELRHIGVTVPAIRKVAKAFAKSHRMISHDELITLVGKLWSMQVHESRMIAIELLNARKDLLIASDSAVIEKMIGTSHTWAYVDNLSATTMGGLVVHYPELNAVLDRWSTDENFWLRRAAMLALLIPIRNGGGDFERFGRYAESMLHEKEFFIRKAIGWILRDTSRKRPELVYEWLAQRAHLCSALTIREATRHLPPDQANRLRAAAKSGQKLEPDQIARQSDQ